MKTVLLVSIALGLALPSAAPAQAAPPAKPAKPSKPTDQDALEKAIEAVNRGVGKAKTPGAPDTPAAKPTAPAKPVEDKSDASTPAPPPSTRPPKPQAVSPDPAPPPTTRITSEEDLDFRNKEGLIIFRKNVLVSRPDLRIWSDELQISLNQEPVKKSEPGTATPAPAAAAPSDGSDGFSANNVKQAVAKAAPGGFVVIWRKSPRGEVVAKAREAVYDGATGNITLTGLPEVLQNLKMHLAGGGENHQFVLAKSGDVKVKGGGGIQNDVVQDNKGREIRKSILAQAPVRQGGPSADSPSALPPPPAPPTTPPK